MKDSHAIKGIEFPPEPKKTPLRSVHTTAEYILLPHTDREAKHWLWHRKYLMPYGLSMVEGEFTGDLPMCSEWIKFNAWIKTQYPIQAFFRETVYDFLHFQWYKLRERYWAIKRFFFPRQRWLTKQIPNDWCDKRTLIVDILYMMVVHYIDGEKALENIVLDDTTEHLAFQQGLLECYKWIKFGRVELVAAIDKELTRASELKIRDYTEKYGELQKLETQLSELDTSYCNWIVDNREFLWV